MTIKRKIIGYLISQMSAIRSWYQILQRERHIPVGNLELLPVYILCWEKSTIISDARTKTFRYTTIPCSLTFLRILNVLFFGSLSLWYTVFRHVTLRLCILWAFLVMYPYPHCEFRSCVKLNAQKTSFCHIATFCIKPCTKSESTF